MKIGIFGGSFDPPHRGHLEVAKSALRNANLDKIYFIPAKQNPHKSNFPHASDLERIKMLNALIGSETKFEVSDIEINRPSPSYSIDTLRYLKDKNPTASIYLIVGTDTLKDLDKWKDSSEVLRIISGVIAYPRDKNSHLCPPFLDSSKFIPLDGDLYEESSTMLRELLADQKISSSEDFIPKKVLEVIREYNLYGVKSQATPRT